MPHSRACTGRDYVTKDTVAQAGVLSTNLYVEETENPHISVHQNRPTGRVLVHAEQSTSALVGDKRRLAGKHHWLWTYFGGGPALACTCRSLGHALGARPRLEGRGGEVQDVQDEEGA